MIDAVFAYVQRGGTLDRATGRLLTRLGQTVCRRWQEPDEGIWEVRSGRQHHTYSKAMCWVALDRLLRLDAAGHLRVPVHAFGETRKAIRAAIEAHGYNPRLESYVSVFDGEGVDASLLLLARYGYVEPNAPRMLATCARVHECLGKNGMLYRYRTHDDGLPPGEGAFGIASFWAVECLAKGGSLGDATAAFEQLLTHANDVGLYAEELDPGTGEFLGNFPQGLTHLALVSAAAAFERAEKQA